MLLGLETGSVNEEKTGGRTGRSEGEEEEDRIRKEDIRGTEHLRKSGDETRLRGFGCVQRRNRGDLRRRPRWEVGGRSRWWRRSKSRRMRSRKREEEEKSEEEVQEKDQWGGFWMKWGRTWSEWAWEREVDAEEWILFLCLRDSSLHEPHLSLHFSKHGLFFHTQTHNTTYYFFWTSALSELKDFGLK